MGFLLLIEFISQRQGVAQSAALWLLLAGALALTYWECRERGYRLKVLLWWLSFVALTHVLGYLVLRLVRRPESES